MPTRLRSRLHCSLLALATWLLATVVAAQARVVVEVRNPGGEAADGEIVLAPQSGSGPSFRCRTREGSCELTDVPGGTYVATLQPASGEPPSPRVVVIPPAGRVTLRVSTR